jgi:hypothetical protein
MYRRKDRWSAPEHQRALEIIDGRRDDELDKERAKSRRGGVFLFSRIERGDVVEYRDMRRSIHDRPSVVRRSPS